MYKQIVDPQNSKFVNVNSIRGKNIIKQYLKFIVGGMEVPPPSPPPPPQIQAKKTFQELGIDHIPIIITGIYDDDFINLTRYKEANYQHTYSKSYRDILVDVKNNLKSDRFKFVNIVGSTYICPQGITRRCPEVGFPVVYSHTLYNFNDFFDENKRKEAAEKLWSRKIFYHNSIDELIKNENKHSVFVYEERDGPSIGRKIEFIVKIEENFFKSEILRKMGKISQRRLESAKTIANQKKNNKKTDPLVEAINNITNNIEYDRSFELYIHIRQRERLEDAKKELEEAKKEAFAKLENEHKIPITQNMTLEEAIKEAKAPLLELERKWIKENEEAKNLKATHEVEAEELKKKHEAEAEELKKKHEAEARPMAEKINSTKEEGAESLKKYKKILKSLNVDKQITGMQDVLTYIQNSQDRQKKRLEKETKNLNSLMQQPPGDSRTDAQIQKSTLIVELLKSLDSEDINLDNETADDVQ